MYTYLFTIYIHQSISFCFFFNDTPTTEIYTLSLHDALPILSTNDWNLGVDGLVRNLFAHHLWQVMLKNCANNSADDDDCEDHHHPPGKCALTERKARMQENDWITDQP